MSGRAPMDTSEIAERRMAARQLDAIWTLSGLGRLGEDEGFSDIRERFVTGEIDENEAAAEIVESVRNG